jgi:hypothetical protein
VSGNAARSGGGISTDDAASGPTATIARESLFSGNTRNNCSGRVIDEGGNSDTDGSCGF